MARADMESAHGAPIVTSGKLPEELSASVRAGAFRGGAAR